MHLVVFFKNLNLQNYHPWWWLEESNGSPGKTKKTSHLTSSQKTDECLCKNAYLIMALCSIIVFLHRPAGQIRPRTLAEGYRGTEPSTPSSPEQSGVSVKRQSVCVNNLLHWRVNWCMLCIFKTFNHNALQYVTYIIFLFRPVHPVLSLGVLLTAMIETVPNCKL